jgi:hypothetical protein
MTIMKKIIILFAVITFSVTKIIAQNDFAPIGSKWHYGYYKDTENYTQEYFTYESVKDTLIEGKTCKKLDIWYFNKDKKATYWGFDILFSDSGRVFYYYKNKFNILYDFNLKVGDSINLLLYNPNIPGIKNLDDTHYVKYKIRNKGNVTINNKKIRFYDIRPATYDSLISNGMQLFFQGRIYEKIGDSLFLYGFLIPYNYDFYAYLRCYSDTDFQYQLKLNVPCDTIYSNIEQNDKSNFGLLFYPNPATDKINIDCTIRQSLKMQVYNTVGQCVLQKELNTQTNTIDISSLTRGIYILKLTSPNGTYEKKIIKE